MTSEVATIDYRGTSIYAQDEYVAVRQMAEAMGLNANAQRELILRCSWSTGWTRVIRVQVPGDNQTREHFFLHRRRVPMWVAKISEDRIADETVKATVIRWQSEIADVLANHYEGKPAAKAKTPRRKRVAGPGTPFPDELEYLQHTGASRVRLPSGFEIEFATEGILYATSLVKGIIRAEFFSETERAEAISEDLTKKICAQAGQPVPPPNLRTALGIPSSVTDADLNDSKDKGRSF